MSLRVLVVETDPQRAEEISGLLESAHHEVLPLTHLEEASEALSIQGFDAVLVPAAANDDELQKLASKLRLIERKEAIGHIPLLSCAPKGIEPTGRSPIEAFLPPDFEAEAFAATVNKLARGVSMAEKSGLSFLPADMPAFDPENFQEQMGFDTDLMIEIIDLYLEESAKQRGQMKSDLESGQLRELSRTAHTIKGSLGTLHAPRARVRSQDLESGAKAGNQAMSAAALDSLELELSTLEAVLLQFRDSQKA